MSLLFLLTVKIAIGIELRIYDIRIIIGGVPSDFNFTANTARSFLESRSLLGVGATLGGGRGRRGGWLLPIPEIMYEKYVVIQFCSCKVETRYGYRFCSYDGEEEDWQYTQTAIEPCRLVHT